MMSSKIYVYVCSYQQGSHIFKAEFVFRTERQAQKWCDNWNKDEYASRYLKAIYQEMELHY